MEKAIHNRYDTVGRGDVTHAGRRLVFIAGTSRGGERAERPPARGRPPPSPAMPTIWPGPANRTDRGTWITDDRDLRVRE